MSAFRTIYFRPRLALDWRIPIAALVRTPDGVTSVSAGLLPDSRCLGGVATHGVMRYGIDVLTDCQKWDRLPISMGPHFELGEEVTIPSVEDPAEWVRCAVLPFRRPEKGEFVEHRHHLSTIAWRHLEVWKVAGYVEKELRPHKILETRLIPDGVPAITHYVEGKSSVLLMEPLAVGKEAAKRSIGAAFQKFSAYSGAWNNQGRKHINIAYVLPGAFRALPIDEVASQLSPVAKVIDTGDDSARRWFISNIRATGETLNQLSI